MNFVLFPLAWFSLVLAVAPAAAFAPLTPPSVGPPSTALLRQDERPFMESFRQAMKVNSKEAMTRLVKNRQRDAIWSILNVCEQISNQSSEQLEKEVDALGTAWKSAFDTDFVSIQYEFFSLLRPEFKKERGVLRRRFDLARKRLEQARATKNASDFATAGIDFRTVGEGFEGIGDKFFASECFLEYANCFDKGERGADADPKRAFEGYSRAAKLRKEVDLLDRYYIGALEQAKALEDAGHGDPTKGETAERIAKRAAEATTATTVKTEPAIVNDIDGILRPVYNGADSLHPIWTTLMLGGTGSKVEFGTLENGPQILRTGSSEAMVDVDRDGTGDVEIPLTGNIAPITVTLGQGDAARPWTFLTMIGQQQDTYQGMRFNLGPADEQLSIYVAPASARGGSVSGVAFQVLDDNMDGVYGSDPIDWGHIGVLPNHFQKDMDTILFEGEKRARPWSSLQKVGNTWYHFTSEANGLEFAVYPTDVVAGQLDLSFKGGKPDWLIVKGVSANNKDAYFDLAAGKVDVPAGSYELFQGQLSKGKRAQTMKSLILPGAKAPTWSVAEGETTKVELGAPFDFVFDVDQTDETVSVVGASIGIVGQAGEVYQRFWNCVPQPEVNVREEGRRKGSEVGKLKPADSQEAVSDAGDYKVAWFPRDDTFDKKKSGETVEVQLFEKKNKLFGKVGTSWRK
ncbi:MAG: hypothetical protein WD226_10215 [Planctomycetota bacterium]